MESNDWILKRVSHTFLSRTSFPQTGRTSMNLYGITQRENIFSSFKINKNKSEACPWVNLKLTQLTDLQLDLTGNKWLETRLETCWPRWNVCVHLMFLDKYFLAVSISLFRIDGEGLVFLIKKVWLCLTKVVSLNLNKQIKLIVVLFE